MSGFFVVSGHGPNAVRVVIPCKGGEDALHRIIAVDANERRNLLKQATHVGTLQGETLKWDSGNGMRSFPLRP